MTWVFAALVALVVWAAGYTAGAREATRRAEKRAREAIARDHVDDFGQRYELHVGENGGIWYEVVP